MPFHREAAGKLIARRGYSPAYLFLKGLQKKLAGVGALKGYGFQTMPQSLKAMYGASEAAPLQASGRRFWIFSATTESHALARRVCRVAERLFGCLLDYRQA